MSLPIYDAIRDFYGYSGSINLPAGDNGVFFGFAGCTRSVLEYALNLLRSKLGAWYGVDDSTRRTRFYEISRATSNATGADVEGVNKFCNWAFVAAKGDADIYSWFAGADFGTLDYWGKVFSDTFTSKAQNVAETIEYGINYETKAEKTLINRVLPVAGLVAACFLLEKVLD